MSKNRIRIPQINKIRAILQQEINSKCPFCENLDVGHFQIHHIDENPDNNVEENLILICPTCHSKITKRDISIEEVVKIKSNLKNNQADIQFISVSVDSANCGWCPMEGINNAFEVTKEKSLFPIFNFTFINHTEKTVLLTHIELYAKRMPVGLSGPNIPLPSILRPTIKYKISLPESGTSINTILKDELQIPKEVAFKFQVEVFARDMDCFKRHFKYALQFKFGFNNSINIDIPKILLNTDKEYDELKYYIMG